MGFEKSTECFQSTWLASHLPKTTTGRLISVTSNCNKIIIDHVFYPDFATRVHVSHLKVNSSTGVCPFLSARYVLLMILFPQGTIFHHIV